MRRKPQARRAEGRKRPTVAGLDISSARRRIGAFRRFVSWDEGMTNKRSRRRRVWLGVGIVGTIVIVAAMAIKYIVAPAAVRRRVETYVKEQWDGALAINSVRFRYFRPVRLEGIVLSDLNGRDWVKADRIMLMSGVRHVLNSQPGRMEADHVTINLYLDEGRLSPPLNNGSDQKLQLHVGDDQDEQQALHSNGGENAYRGLDQDETSGTWDDIHINEIVVHDLKASLWDGDRAVRLLGAAALATEYRHDHLGVIVAEKTGSVWEKLWVGGHIRASDGSSALYVEARRTVAPEEGALLISILGGPDECEAGGLLEMYGTVSGPVSRPAELMVDGKADLAGWSVGAGGHAIVKDLNTCIGVQGRRYEVRDLGCTVWNGCLSGSLWATIDPAGPSGIAFGASLKGKNISVKEVAAGIGAEGRALQGTASGRVNFVMQDNIEDLRGTAVLLFEDTSLSMFPLTAKIIGAMGLPTDDPLAPSLMACAFDFAGAAATIERARFVNSQVAVETQPGGTLNAATGEVDLDVLAAPVQSGYRADEQPAGLENDLLRLRIRGNYWDAASDLISREPAGDIGAETRSFLKRVAAARTRRAGLVGNPLEEVCLPHP